MIGKKKPTAELAVAPKIAIGTLIVVNGMAQIAGINWMSKVQNTFYLAVNFLF